MARIDRVQVVFADRDRVSIEYQVVLAPVDEGFWFVEEVELLRRSQHLGGSHRILSLRSSPWRCRPAAAVVASGSWHEPRTTPLIELSREDEGRDLRAVVTIRPLLPVPSVSRSPGDWNA